MASSRGNPLKLVEQFVYFGSNISTESDVIMWIGKDWTIIDHKGMVIVVGIGHGDTSSNPGRD